MKQLKNALRELWYALKWPFIKKRMVGNKTTEQIKDWLETHGIERSTAAHIMGFLAAHNIRLGQIQLCNHGLTYSFEEFMKWWIRPDEGLKPVENELAIFWKEGNHVSACVSVYKEMKNGLYCDCAGRMWGNAIRFCSIADLRMIINVPDDLEIPLNLEHIEKARGEYAASCRAESKPKHKKKNTGAKTTKAARDVN